MTRDEIYQDLPDQIRQGNCVLILGMGIYRGTSQVTGGMQLPDDVTLAHELAQRVGYTEGPLSLPLVAQSYEWKEGRPQLIEDIRKLYRPFANVSLPALATICRLPFKAIMTTCVDNLIENEFARQDKSFKWILPQQAISRQETETSPEILTKLRQDLADRFSEDELRSLCFDMQEDYENLGGEGKAGKARELVTYLERRRRIHELVRNCSRLRPDASWEDALEATRTVFIAPEDRLLVKLHGTLDDPGSLVLTDSDYTPFFNDLASAFHAVKALCSKSTLLFLGFELEDQNFRRLYEQLTTQIAKSIVRAYAFDGEPSDYTRRWCQMHNVAIVHIKAADLLTDLEKLVYAPTVEQKYRPLQEACQLQTKRQLDELRRHKYDPGLYVAREKEARLDDFISSDKNGLILVGDSGTGKTNLLCHLAEKWTQDEHLALYYDCGGSLGIDVEAAITRDLAPTASAPFDVGVEQIATLAKAKDKCVIWIFDAINEFRDGENRAGELLKRLDAIIGRARMPNLKLVLTCRTATWEILVTLGRTRLFWSKYYPSPEQPLLLDKFTSQEFEEAYPLYQQHYKISTDLSALSDRTCARLHDPLLLQMSAVAYTGRRVPSDALSLGVLRDYCVRQTGQRIKDTQFLNRFATVLLEQGVQAVSRDRLLDDALLSGEMGDDPDCAFGRLKDVGLLTEIAGELDRLVKFTYDRLLEFFIANYWRGQVQKPAELGEYLEKVLPAHEQYAPAWSAAAMAVAREPSEATLLRLSRSLNYRVRQVAVDSLVALYVDKPDKAKSLLQYLVAYRPEPKSAGREAVMDKSGMELPLRTALKAARRLGDGASDIFVEAAAAQDDQRRDTVANELYVLWQQDAGLGFGILRKIISSINPGLSWKPGRWLEFAARFSLGLFSNHCHQPEIIQQLSDIWWDEFENKYKIKDWFGIGVVQGVVDTGIRLAAQVGIASAVMNTVTFGGTISLERFFTDAEIKASMLRLVDYLDPAMDVTSVLPDLATLLSSDLMYPNAVASLILTVHTYHDFERMEGTWEHLFETLSGAGRLWMLLTFALLAPTDVPPEPMVNLVVRLTQRILQESREDFFQGPQGIFKELDIGLLPLGMTYGKLGLRMEYLSQMIQQAQVNDLPLLERIVGGLAAIGLYYPDAALELLNQALAGQISESPLRDVAVQTCATMGVFYNDQVEQFLLKIGADESFRGEVQAHEDASLVKLYVDAVGLFNVGAYGCLYYPRIRTMVQTTCRAATECRDLPELVRRIAQAYIALVLDSNYRIIQMIDRD